WCDCSHTIAHHATASLAQNSMDGLADRMDSSLLAAVPAAEISFPLRHRKYPHWPRVVVGESAHFFLAGVRAVAFSGRLHDRSGKRAAHRPAHHRRHRIHVRSQADAADSPAQSVSCGDTTTAAMGDLAFGL